MGQWAMADHTACNRAIMPQHIIRLHAQCLWSTGGSPRPQHLIFRFKHLCSPLHVNAAHMAILSAVYDGTLECKQYPCSSKKTHYWTALLASLALWRSGSSMALICWLYSCPLPMPMLSPSCCPLPAFSALPRDLLSLRCPGASVTSAETLVCSLHGFCQNSKTTKTSC